MALLSFEYIKFCFDRNFAEYPVMKLDSLNKFIDIAIEQVLIDANAKFHNGKKVITSEEELVTLIQKDPTIEAVFYYRLERQLFLQDQQHPLLPYLASTMRRNTGSEIYYSTDIGNGFNIQHGFGIVIGPRFKIGNNFTIHQGVTLGQKNLNSPDETIIIGNNVTVFSGATILGNIRIGNNAKIGANSVLLQDVEESTIYAGVPAKFIK